MKRYAWTAIIGVTLLLLLVLPFSVPAHANQPVPLAAPTPVTAPAHATAPNAPEFPTFFNAKVLTADTRSDCFEVPEYSVVDLQWDIDQTVVASAANTTTFTLQFSNDNVKYVNGLAVATSNVADATDMQQFAIFGRFACIYADVSNTNPVTVTAIGVVK